MAASNEVLPALRTYRDTLEDWVDGDEYALPKLVVGVTLLGLVLRLIGLGDRVAHFDEARVAYWAWHLSENGGFVYRRIVHGPLIQHVDSWLFTLFGASDVTMRLFVALVGGFFPLAALLFREHLRRSEVVALAALLALNPVLLYYSRFMRSDVLVAAFMFTAFGLLVRFYDTRLPRYLYGVAFFGALGFASKENAIIYVVTWLGATGLLVAKVTVLPRGYRDAVAFLWSVPSGTRVKERVVGRIKELFRWVVASVRGFRQRHDSPLLVLGDYALHIGSALVVFGAVSLFFYAARGDALGVTYSAAAISQQPIPFWEGVTTPAKFRPMVHDTASHVVAEYSQWFKPATEKTTTESGGLVQTVTGIYQESKSHYGVLLKALGYASAPLVAFSLLGYALDRTGTVRPRHLVPFTFYCGAVSVVGYPIGTDIGAPWLAVHVVVPLAVPAAVALAAVFRWGLDALATDDREGVATAALVLVLVVALVGNVAVTNVYTNTDADGNPLVQYAQPGNDLRESLTTIDRVAGQHSDGPDVVVYYGETSEQYADQSAYVEGNREKWDTSFYPHRVDCIRWYNSLPLGWYFAASDAAVACENEPTALGVRLRQEQPPVVITQQIDGTVSAERLRQAGYVERGHRMRTSGYTNVFSVWVHESYRNG